MILTRQGFNSKMVVTGDPTQIDLPNGTRSGLIEAVDVLRGVEGISFVQFDDRDVVRHSLVQKIVKAYERYNEVIGVNRQLSLRLGDGEAAPAPGIATTSARPRRLSGAPMSPDDIPLLVRNPSRRIRQIADLRAFFAQMVRRVARGRQIECLITDDAELRRLNRQFRGANYATDVLSFPSGTAAGRSPSRSTARHRRPSSTATPFTTNSAS